MCDIVGCDKNPLYYDDYGNELCGGCKAQCEKERSSGDFNEYYLIEGED